jgi:hypothetical protein
MPAINPIHRILCPELFLQFLPRYNSARVLQQQQENLDRLALQADQAPSLNNSHASGSTSNLPKRIRQIGVEAPMDRFLPGISPLDSLQHYWILVNLHPISLQVE